ncbi:hypothetical protein, partial [Clostridium porci]|uniref:hypothetical protein n=1 Tax=Clostridium porci TaxID=2605778 RepID=UPI003A93D690
KESLFHSLSYAVFFSFSSAFRLPKVMAAVPYLTLFQPLVLLYQIIDGGLAFLHLPQMAFQPYKEQFAVI